MSKKRIISTLIAIAVIGFAAFAWNKWASNTKIALVNFRIIQQGDISKANDNDKIKISEVSLEELDKLTSYDMVLISGMGMRIVEEQRELIQKAANKGVPMYTMMATNPANNICNLDSIQKEQIAAYITNGGKTNYKNMLNYIRKEIDRKKYGVKDFQEPIERANDVIYHADASIEDEKEFSDIDSYEAYLKEKGLYKDNAPKIVVTGQMADQTELIAALEEKGYNVYPIRALSKMLYFLNTIKPEAVVNLAHGRMGDHIVKFLKENNVLLFDPLTINSLTEEWEEHPMGMNGGFLSQSVAMPEIDGAVLTYAVFAQYEDKEGLRHSYAVPERLETFVEAVGKYLKLKKMPNSEKKIAIYYYKGPGQGALTASGMEVVPSIYNTLLMLKKEGYKVENLPDNHHELEKMIQKQGSVLGAYADGAFEEFMRVGNPELVSKEQYDEWVKKTLRPEKYAEVVQANGEFPGKYMNTPDGKIGVARLQFGNVVILPQNAAGEGENSFQVVHGTNAAPPHPFIASYLWVQHGFKADVLMHFGTHGSLEYTPKKQVALCHKDWSDRMVGSIPHFYIYTIGNVGEAMIAKRRSYAVIQSHITPPFMESSLRGTYRQLMEKIKMYFNAEERKRDKLSVEVKDLALQMGIPRELGLDSIKGKPYNEEEVTRIENFAEEIATEKITGQYYTLGVPYEYVRITSSVYAMATEPIAYSLYALDKMRGKAANDLEKRKSLFTQQYLNPAKELVTKLLVNPSLATDELICKVANISKEELDKAREIERQKNAPKGMMAMMMAMSQTSDSNEKKTDEPNRQGVQAGKTTHPMSAMGANNSKKSIDEMIENAKKMGAPEEALKKMRASLEKKQKESDNNKPKGEGMSTNRMLGMSMSQINKKEYSKEEINFAEAVNEVERTVKNIVNYKNALLNSPKAEFDCLLNSMKGGYTAPSPGGDPIANPNTIPTGRNMYSINAEATPSESAWDKGISLAKQTIAEYRKRHNDSIPRKVSYTLWSSEFIETGGATIAQVLYMLGVEPIRDAFGRVNDLRLIPSKDLGRPRIDVVVQTSGQLRDLAASRLFLINRAVEMAANAKDDEYTNLVAESVVEAERVLTERGVTPKEAREMSTFRVFGGMNGMYGTGIQEMVEAGDKWESEDEVAKTYINNMGAYYGDEKKWETFRKYAFEAALTRTDAVVQPRQSNTWGALSLDHVYEFMGGLNLAVRHVTGKDPDAYLSDYRNRNNMRMQELKESIGIESRTTILNPTYIKERMKGEATSADEFAETITNIYGWNVMKPKAIDKELWDNIYDVYVKDKYNLKTKEFFETKNHAALQEMTAVMLETVRKGLWKATDEQVAEMTKLHAELIDKYKPACSGFVCDNSKLREFISSKLDDSQAKEYKKSISKVREENVDTSADKGVVMKKEELSNVEQKQNTLSNLAIIVSAVAVLVLIAIFVRKRRKNNLD